MVNVFVKQNGNVLGPLSLEKVLTSYQRGQISSSAMISDNQTTWYPISNLEKLQAQSKKTDNSLIEPEPLPSAPYQQAIHQAPSQPYAQPMQQPYAQSTKQPYGQPMQQPYEQPMQQPYGQTMQQPYGQSMQQPYYTQQFAQGVNIHCSNCGQEIPANAVVCFHCGVSVGSAKNFCPNCGRPVNANQAICLGCGCSLTQMGNGLNNAQNSGQKIIQPKGQSASQAMILSCLITGLGQIYLGQTMKGLVLLASAFVLGPISWIIAIVDAYRIGQKLEAGQSVGEWEFF